MFINLASDSSKLVRTGALQHLGRLISTLPGESVTEELVHYFTATAVESMGDPVVSLERFFFVFVFTCFLLTVWFLPLLATLQIAFDLLLFLTCLYRDSR